MDTGDVLKALVIRGDTLDLDRVTAEDRILIAASLAILQTLAAAVSAPRFDIKNEGEKALLTKAVGAILPEALDDEDWKVVQFWNYCEMEGMI